MTVDVYDVVRDVTQRLTHLTITTSMTEEQIKMLQFIIRQEIELAGIDGLYDHGCLLYTSPSPRD